MAQKKKNENYRNRTHMLELYPDNPSHVKAMEKIEKSYECAYILHDKDVKEDGNLKKPHWHVVLRFKDAKWRSALCTELEIEERFCEEPRSFDNCLMYLIHYNDTDKYQYDVKEVKGTIKKRLKELINKVDKSEGEKVYELIDYIENQTDVIRVTAFAKYCANNGYWAEFRRSGMIFCKMIDEHNGMIREKTHMDDMARNQERMAEITKKYREEKALENGKWEQSQIDFENM